MPGTGDHDTWNHAAILWARTDNRAEYRAHCRRMLDRFGRTTEPQIAERTAKACLLLPLAWAWSPLRSRHSASSRQAPK